MVVNGTTDHKETFCLMGLLNVFLNVISFYVIGGFCLSASESLFVSSLMQQLDIFLELTSCMYQALCSGFCRKPGFG